MIASSVYRQLSDSTVKLQSWLTHSLIFCAFLLGFPFKNIDERLNQSRWKQSKCFSFQYLRFGFFFVPIFDFLKFWFGLPIWNLHIWLYIYVFKKKMLIVVLVRLLIHRTSTSSRAIRQGFILQKKCTCTARVKT